MLMAAALFDKRDDKTGEMKLEPLSRNKRKSN